MDNFLIVLYVDVFLLMLALWICYRDECLNSLTCDLCSNGVWVRWLSNSLPLSFFWIETDTSLLPYTNRTAVWHCHSCGQRLTDPCYRIQTGLRCGTVRLSPLTTHVVLPCIVSNTWWMHNYLIKQCIE